MSFNPLRHGLDLTIPIKHKIFVSYHHGLDQNYYTAFSSAFHDTHEVVYDNSLERALDSEDTTYVMRRIRENHIHGTSCTFVLVGAQTFNRKYVDWEIYATLEKQHALIGVYLPTAQRNEKNQIVVPGRLHDNVASGYATWLSWNQATLNASKLQDYIAEAKLRRKQLIDNSRERRLRNG